MRRLTFVFIIVLIGVAALPVQAQLTCSALVQQALTQVGGNCANLDRNNACYGYNDVNATFTEAVPNAFFSTPADRAQLGVLKSLSTAPLDTENDVWGIATLNVQANLPNALPGQSVVFILLGAAQVEDAVPPEDALILPAAPLQVMTTEATTLRLQPDATSPAAGDVAAQVTLAADGMSADGDWLRVYFAAERQAAAWVESAAVAPNPALADLPVITPQSRTPMQAFRFQTDIGGLRCDDAPSLLVVQGPEDFEVDITANGLDVRVGSTILLASLPGGGVQIMVISGRALLNPNSLNPLTLLPGFSMSCPITTLLSDGNCDWDDPEAFDNALQEMLDNLDTLFTGSSNLFHYIPALPIVTCPSGIGSVQCEIIFNSTNVDLSQAASYCADHPTDRMCSALFR